LNADVQKIDEDTKILRQKMAGANSRLESLEKELKELKIEDASKARILLEKSANADRLIEALKQEIARLKKIKVERAQEPDSPPKDKIYVNSPLQLIRKRIERR